MDLSPCAVTGYAISGFRRTAPAPGVPERAPLAQSAERFHGKEKVDSSILSGGSSHFAMTASDSGGVAQMVRAHDS